MSIAIFWNSFVKAIIVFFSVVYVGGSYAEIPTFMRKRMMLDDPNFVVSESNIIKFNNERYTVTAKLKNVNAATQAAPAIQIILKTFEGDIHLLVIVPPQEYWKSQKPLKPGEIITINLKNYLYAHNSEEQGAVISNIQAVKPNK